MHVGAVTVAKTTGVNYINVQAPHSEMVHVSGNLKL